MIEQHKPGIYSNPDDAVSAIGLWITLGLIGWAIIAAAAVGVYRLAF